MAAQQAEFVAFKTEVTASIQRLESVVTQSNTDAAAAAAIIAELRRSYSSIS